MAGLPRHAAAHRRSYCLRVMLPIRASLDASSATAYNEVDFGRGMAAKFSPPPQCQENPSREYTMSYGYEYPVARAASSERALFIRRTYAHLAGAILAFMGVEVVLFQVLGTEGQQQVLRLMLGGYNWLIVMLAFMGASWL